jgi:YHS domain-containing protein
LEVEAQATKEQKMNAIDPVCGMEVDPAQAAATSEYQGQTYYFCSKGCKQAFDKEPEKYLNPSASTSGHSQHH